MKILVLADEQNNLGDKWSELWSMLDAAKEAGVTWEKSYYNIDRPSKHAGYDAYILIDLGDYPYYGKPYIEVSSLHDGDAELTDKVQELASYMFGKADWMDPRTPDTDEPPVETENLVIDVADLGYEVSAEDVATLTIKEFVVNIEGKDICIPKEDLVALGKVANLMDKFGYTVKRVIV